MSQSNIKIVYGTGGGNTKLICEKVSEILETKGHNVQMLEAKNLEPSQIGEFDLLVLASPTHGHGEIEAYMGKFLNKLESVDMKGWKCSIIGLGDPKYDMDYHLESIRIIMTFLKEKEAETVGMPLRISRSPFLWLDQFVPMWAEKLDKLLTEQQ